MERTQARGPKKAEKLIDAQKRSGTEKLKQSAPRGLAEKLNLNDICDDVLIYVICDLIEDKIMVDYILYIINRGDLTEDANIKYVKKGLKPVYNKILSNYCFLSDMYNMIEAVQINDIIYFKINYGCTLSHRDSKYDIIIRDDPYIEIYRNLFRIYRCEIDDMIKNDFLVNTKRFIVTDIKLCTGLKEKVRFYVGIKYESCFRRTDGSGGYRYL